MKMAQFMNDPTRDRSYVGPILPLVQWPPEYAFPSKFWIYWENIVLVRGSIQLLAICTFFLYTKKPAT